MSFHDVRFPASIAFGSVGGPERRTEIVVLGSGFEERNSPWAHGRRRYDAGLGLRTLNDLYTVIAFFEARQGRLYAFRWKDHLDFRSGLPGNSVTIADQVIGAGNGAATVFQLSKAYVSGPVTYTRTIKKPVAGTVQIAVGGVAQTLGSGFTVDAAKGLVTLTAAPANGVPVTAGFEFDVPVRFDTDRLELNLAAFKAG
ncbi:MAG TPA: TIGR02217 family protein, partial [Alphaproteobacteria bacterium]|nr:TIGR02217 family protein [Alphaproteobacteria bacterium]